MEERDPLAGADELPGVDEGFIDNAIDRTADDTVLKVVFLAGSGSFGFSLALLGLHDLLPDLYQLGAAGLCFDHCGSRGREVGLRTQQALACIRCCGALGIEFVLSEQLLVM